jgi:hypothetical protein
VIILDSGALTWMSHRSGRAPRFLNELRAVHDEVEVVHCAVLIESLTGRDGHDANVNRFLKSCRLITALPEALARRAAALRHLARRGSAVDALLVALAEPDGLVLTTDHADLKALAAHASGVKIETI